jgi:uncharacterized protein YndB with AHSA1/START domain
VGHQRTVDAPAGQPSISFSRTVLTVREFDARSGGRWSYVVSATNGGSSAFSGTFHEVTAPTRIVQTFEYEGDPGHPSMEVFTFVDLGPDHCRVDGLSVFLSVADRDAVLYDLDAGRDEDFDRLDEYLAAAGDR